MKCRSSSFSYISCHRVICYSLGSSDKILQTSEMKSFFLIAVCNLSFCKYKKKNVKQFTFSRFFAEKGYFFIVFLNYLLIIQKYCVFLQQRNAIYI